jgi:hypothetical protein
MFVWKSQACERTHISQISMLSTHYGNVAVCDAEKSSGKNLNGGHNFRNIPASVCVCMCICITRRSFIPQINGKKNIRVVLVKFRRHRELF